MPPNEGERCERVERKREIEGKEKKRKGVIMLDAHDQASPAFVFVPVSAGAANTKRGLPVTV